MKFVDEILISRGVLQARFCCDIQSCRGICCVEGDYGAPLEDEEISNINEILEKHMDDFGEESRKVIAKTGAAVWYEKKQIWGTPLRKDGSCVYSRKNPEGIHICIIEDLYNKDQIEFNKPISCHLYPLRIKQVGEYTVLNYDEWDICENAVKLGGSIGLSVVAFCKDALVRRFGEEFYSGLIEEIEKEPS
jgi:hypothetical protein